VHVKTHLCIAHELLECGRHTIAEQLESVAVSVTDDLFDPLPCLADDFLKPLGDLGLVCRRSFKQPRKESAAPLTSCCTSVTAGTKT
jgi:hypothetical protein